MDNARTQAKECEDKKFPMVAFADFLNNSSAMNIQRRIDYILS